MVQQMSNTVVSPVTEAASMPQTERTQAKSAIPRIFVVVVTYNGQKWLDKCLGTLHDSEVKFDIVVVDNGSSDGTPEVISKKWPDVKLIQPGENLGFGRANNIGIAYAVDKGFDYIYLLNQDAWISPGDILEMARLQSLNPQYGVLSPMQMQADWNTPDANFERCCNEPNCLGYKNDISSGATLKDIYEVRYIMAAHWLMSAETIRRIGGFAPIFKHYGEDYNYLDRLKYHGLKVGICPAIKAVHDRGTRKEESLKKAMARVYNSVFLTLACDITKSSLNSYQHALRALAKETSRQTSQYESLKPLSNIFKAIGDTVKIAETRRDTKVLGKHYL